MCSDSVGTNVLLRRATADFGDGTNVMLIFANGTWTVRSADSVGSSTSSGTNCSGSHVSLTLDSTACAPSGTGLGNAGSANARPTTCAGASPCCTLDPATGIGFGTVVRYRINNDSDGIPNLERAVNGGNWQVVARAVEDLQVKYVKQSGAEDDNAPAVDPLFADYTTLITQVKVTLSARAVTTRIQGATYASGTTGAALRGTLTAQITPRQALSTLTTESGTPKWN